MFFSTVVYNTYIMSTLSYIAQLEAPNEEVLTKERDTLMSIFKGPYRWISKEDLWSLKEKYWQGMSCRSLMNMSKASMLRVSNNEEWLQHKVHELNNILKQAISNTTHYDRLSAWSVFVTWLGWICQVNSPVNGRSSPHMRTAFFNRFGSAQGITRR